MKIKIDPKKYKHITHLPNIIFSFARKHIYIDIFLFKKCWFIDFDYDN